MKKIFIVILTIIIACFFVIWGMAILKCEVLTFKHGDEFKKSYEQTNMLGEMEYFKILDYSETTATVYYVSENMSGGNVLEFVKQNEEWVYSNWETIWSKTGSASDIIWPYWWHFIYGGI